MQGPSEAKFGSKADYTKAFIEVNLRMAHTDVNSNEGVNNQVKQEIAALLRQSLESIIQTVAYPKQVFTFTVSIVHESSPQAYSQAFAASLNACVALLNQAAIAQIEAPVAALTVAIDA